LLSTGNAAADADAATVTHGNNYLQGDLVIPSAFLSPKALIIFALGDESGTVRANPINQYVVRILNDNGFATLLIDLLTPKEYDSDIETQNTIGNFPGFVLNKFNIYLLAVRLSAITDWVIENVLEVKDYPVGYFGTGAGAAAAMEASTTVYNPHAHKIFAIVSICGRPDLSYHDTLRKVKASTLLIVGAKDSKLMVDINRKALNQLKNAKSKDLVMISDAGHLFDEGSMDQAVNIAARWYARSLGNVLNKRNGSFISGR
jgi:dienelactone hydrolase